MFSFSRAWCWVRPAALGCAAATAFLPIRAAPAAAQGPAAGAQRSAAAAQGEALFKQSGCVACHRIGGGRLVGPDLKGVTERRSEAWIIPFVQHSQDVIHSGDSVATALFEQFGRMVMPDHDLSADQVRSILAYVREAGAAAGAASSAAAPPPAPVAKATPEQIRLGQDLFQGRVRFANGGPACNSCHEVTNDAVIGGGVLAKELTTVFSRLGGPGVRAILGSPPFPVMQRAFQDRPLTDEEVTALVGFLREADAEHAFHQPRDYGIRLFSAGVIGAVILLAFYSLLWRGRRKGPVNQAIFERQVTST